MKNKYVCIYSFVFVLIVVCGFVAFNNVRAYTVVTNIAIEPELDISIFSPYRIKADIDGSPTEVSVDISGINGDGAATWDYNVDGTPQSETRVKKMAYDEAQGKWISERIYPDDIYPEIYFAPSSLTWYNTPQNTPIRRNNYQIFHIRNPFTMEANMSFFIEINALPSSTQNSQDLDVYLVKNQTPTSFFESNWMNDRSEAELVASIGKDETYHHTHTEDSAHLLIPLQTNSDGTIGKSHMDVSSDFWVVLYSNSLDEDKGWQLTYFPSDTCSNTNAWYLGQRTDWAISSQEGCPNMHIHVARRDNFSDGARAIVTVDGSVSSKNFYFKPMPNMAPNATSFLTPLENQIIDGNVEHTVKITWDPASDPNNDSLIYKVYLVNGENITQISPLLTQTSFDWNIAEVPSGTYGLKGLVCDNASPALCADFFLTNFEIERGSQLHTLSEIKIASNNSDPAIAKAGDTVTLYFVSTGDIATSTEVKFFSGGREIKNASVRHNDGNSWTVAYEVDAAHGDGVVDFLISAENLEREYSETTDTSSVTIVSTKNPPDEKKNGGGTSGSGIVGGINSSGSGITIGSAESSSSSPVTVGGSTTTRSLEVSDSQAPVLTDASVEPQQNEPVFPVKKYSFLKNLKIGMIDKDVLELQRYLNNAGYMLTKEGTGSPGRETEKFGILTKIALIKLQENNAKEILKPWDLQNGTGFCGTTTRAFLNK
jgi:hypothetical protein